MPPPAGAPPRRRASTRTRRLPLPHRRSRPPRSARTTRSPAARVPALRVQRIAAVCSDDPVPAACSVDSDPRPARFAPPTPHIRARSVHSDDAVHPGLLGALRRRGPSRPARFTQATLCLSGRSIRPVHPLGSLGPPAPPAPPTPLVPPAPPTRLAPPGSSGASGDGVLRGRRCSGCSRCPRCPRCPGSSRRPRCSGHSRAQSSEVPSRSLRDAIELDPMPRVPTGTFVGQRV